MTADEIVELRRRRPDLSNRAIARQLGVSRRTAQRAMAAAGLANAWKELPQHGKHRNRPTRICVVCSEPIQRQALDTDVTYSSRDVCGGVCMRVVKGTQAERGKMRWTQEVRA